MNRGVDHQTIFKDTYDYDFFLSTIKNMMKRYDFKIHTYCLMTNHYHLLIETGQIEIWKIMKMLNSQYARYYNIRHKRDGTLFRGRYKSVQIRDDAHFLQVSRYICMNPVMAFMVDLPGQYAWSSYLTLMGKYNDSITSVDRIMSYFDNKASELNKFITSDIYITEEQEITDEIDDNVL